MAAQWWSTLEGCDPISQMPLQELPYPPFELGGETSRRAGDKAKQKRGNQAAKGQFFDARLLANYMVSTGRFECPVTRRAVYRAECVALDEHLKTYNLGESKCLEAWTLTRNRKGGRESDQSLAMRREAAAVLGALLGYGPSTAALALGNHPPPERRSLPPPPPSVWATNTPTGTARSGAAVVAASTASAAAPTSTVVAQVTSPGVQSTVYPPPPPPQPADASTSHPSASTSSSTSLESEFSHVSISTEAARASSASDDAAATTTTTTMHPHPPTPTSAAAAPSVPSAELLYCSACSCALPANSFSKAQRKKAVVAKSSNDSTSSSSSSSSSSSGGGSSNGHGSSPTTSRDGVNLGSGKCSSCLENAPQLVALPLDGGAKVNEYYCLTLHQPWASLVVAGVKRLEGRSWLPKTFTHGALWIHAAAAEPYPEEIARVEAQYKRLYELDGVSPEALEAVLPRAYPTRCLLGLVHVAAVLPASDFRRLHLLPKPSLRHESESEVVFLCQQPQRLVVPRSAMSGHHQIWRLAKADVVGATQALRPVDSSILGEPVDFRALYPRYNA